MKTKSYYIPIDKRYKISVAKSRKISASPELPCYGAWVEVGDGLPPFDKQVLVINDGQRLCAVLQNVTRSIAEDSPKDKRWYAVPGWGHQLHKVTHWCELPEAP